jgi:hypothetical protein
MHAHGVPDRRVFFERPFVKVLPLISNIFQICYVTADLNAGMRQLTATHGIDRFRVKSDVESLPGMPTMRMHQAHAYVGQMQIEMIQPAGGDDALYRDVCAADGHSLRFHHYGLWVDDAAEFDGLSPALAEQNVPVAFSSWIPDVGGAIYADMRATLGHYLEYVHLLPAAKRDYYADVPIFESGAMR